MQNIDFKKEFFYFIKALLTVVIISGFISAVTYFAIKGVDIQGTLDQADMIVTLADYRIGIIIFSMVLSTYLLHGDKAVKNKKAFAIQFAKVVTYYGSVQILLYQTL